MSKVKPHPSQELLQEWFTDMGSYLKWNKRGKGIKIDRAGSLGSDGYIQLTFQRSNYKAHRLMWILRNGPIPDGLEVDHIDGDRSNNLDSNHRLGTRSQNARNIIAMKSNTSGHTGISPHCGKWVVHIRLNKKPTHVGYYETIEEAIEARDEAWALHYGEFTCRGY